MNGYCMILECFSLLFLLKTSYCVILHYNNVSDRVLPADLQFRVYIFVPFLGS